MHFNFHLSGDESAEQTRRIANAVLALGGLTPATFESQTTTEHSGTHNIIAPEAFAEALRERTYLPGIADGAKWVEEDAITANAGETPSEVVHFDVTDFVTGERKVISVPPAPPAAKDHVEDPTRDVAEQRIFVEPSILLAEASGGTRDSKGLPWDERIHSGSRKFNADGSWRYRKNVPDETKAAVEGELRGLVYGEAVDAVAAATLEGMQKVDAALNFTPPSPLAPPLPPSPKAVNAPDIEPIAGPIAPPIPPAPPTTAARTYPDVVNLIMKHKITPETYVAIIGSDLPTFAATCKTDPNAASVAFDALDRASRS